MKLTTVVGIAGYHFYQKENHLLDLDINTVPKALTDALHQAGMLPIIFPLTAPEDAAKYMEQVDALILAGGADIDPIRYGEEPRPKIGVIEPDRDRFETALIEEATKQKKAILGICRGSQLLNVAFGGSLYQDLSYYSDLQINHQQSTPWEYPTHSIKIEKNSILAECLSTQNVVNSVHHQAVRELAEPFRAIAWSADGVVEAFESKNSNAYILAMQWHPELLIQNHPEQLMIFKKFHDRIRPQTAK